MLQSQNTVVMDISFWDCKFSDYEEDSDSRHYGCLHIKGCGVCELRNKLYNNTEFCELAEKNDS